MPARKSDGVSSLFSEVGKSRKATADKIKAAVDEWQGCCKDALSQATNQQELTETVQTWFQPLLQTPASEPENVKAAPAPAKASEAA